MIAKYNKKAEELVLKMTLEEKASLCSGKDFWNLKGIERLGLCEIMLTDGPHGLRKQEGSSDHLGLNKSVPATCFPTAVLTASSFDKELLTEMGEALGQECLKNQVSVILGPGANIKRNPLCGRNFEYISEDPYVASETAVAIIGGVQSKNVGVSMKHYLANNQEYARMASDSVVDERALREIYMPAFENAVKRVQPATLMCAYNKINGTYASDNKEYMTDIPRGEWGYEGLIVTDWGAMNDRVKAIKAGLDLEMPANGGINDENIVNAVKNGELLETDVNKCAIRIVSLILSTQDNKVEEFDTEKHNELARKIAAESGILLKNENILPLAKTDKVLVCGEFAKSPRYQGAGSSKINPIKITTFIQELETQKINFEYAQGYENKSDMPNDVLIEEAVAKAKECEKVVCFVGLPDSYESEGFDRAHMNMPQSHNKLVMEIAKVNPNVVVVLYLGSPVAIPYVNDVKGILNMYLAGQNVGGATFDLLFGDVNPSGKLAETFPNTYDDVSSKKWFAKDAKIVPYKESIYVGYRYYDKAKKEVLYPFGFGLSYTSFEYSNIKTDGMKVSVDVKNTGNVFGKEVVQLYVCPPKSKIYKAERELKGYEKISLEEGETKTVEFTLTDRSFAYWNVNTHDWHVESNEYKIEIGASSRDIRQTTTINVTGDNSIEVPDYYSTAPEYYNLTNKEFDISDSGFEAVLGRKVIYPNIGKPFTISSTLGDVQCTRTGRFLYKKITTNMENTFKEGSNDDLKAMMNAMIRDLPLRALVMLSRGQISLNVVNGMIELMNGHPLRALKSMKKK